MASKAEQGALHRETKKSERGAERKGKKEEKRKEKGRKPAHAERGMAHHPGVAACPPAETGPGPGPAHPHPLTLALGRGSELSLTLGKTGGSQGSGGSGSGGGGDRDRDRDRVGADASPPSGAPSGDGARHPGADAARAVATPHRRKSRPMREAEPFSFSDSPAANAFAGMGAGPSTPPFGSVACARLQAANRAEPLLHASVRILHDWYCLFEERSVCCQRRSTAASTVLAVCNGVLATLSSMPFMQTSSPSWSTSRAGLAVAGLGAFIGLLALITQALAKLGEWDAGAVQCALATQRCLGLHTQVAKDLAGALGDDELAPILSYLLDEMVAIHQCEAVRHLTHRLQPPSAAHLAGSAP